MSIGVVIMTYLSPFPKWRCSRSGLNDTTAMITTVAMIWRSGVVGHALEIYSTHDVGRSTASGPVQPGLRVAPLKREPLLGVARVWVSA